MSRSKNNGRKDDEPNVPVPTVDIIVRDKTKKQIILETRATQPFKGWYSIPGGHVDYGETVEETALRELREETSVRASLVAILGVYSDPKRDPRGQRITTVFVGDWVSGAPKGADDAKTAKWFPVSEVFGLRLAFDHRKILRDYLKWTKGERKTFWSGM